MDDESLGGKFWLKLIGGVIGVIILGGLAMAVFGRVWYAWGFLGAFLLLAGVLLLWGWIYDRRERRKRERLAA